MNDEYKIRLDNEGSFSEPDVDTADVLIPLEAEIPEARSADVRPELLMKSAESAQLLEALPEQNAAIEHNSEENRERKKMHLRLWIYILATMVSFGICVLTPYSHLGITVFAAVQIVSLFTIPQWYQTKRSTFRAMMILSLVLLAVFPLIGGNMCFRGWNYAVSAVLMVWIVLETLGRLPLDENFFLCISNTFSLLFSAIGRMFRPFTWLKRNKNGERGIMRRILLGLLIALPAAILLIWMLSAADSVFLWYLSDFLHWFAKLFTFVGIVKLIISLAVALILSQLLHTALCVPASQRQEKVVHTDKGDVLILGIVFGMICLIYTVFILIQFRYLFAQAELPLGLTYAEYARRGFFALVVLSALNVCIVLCICRALKYTLSVNSVSTGIMKFILWYLCASTAVLLVSAAYRMFLYDQAYGYTRQRLFVYLVLAVEAIVLLLTVLRIINVRWRLARGYAALLLCFYLALNLPGIDAVIASKNIDRFEAGMNLDVKYLTSLSPDAAAQIARLKNVRDKKDEHDRDIGEWVGRYFQKLKDEEVACRYDWRRFSFSRMNAYQIAEDVLKER